jgi:hypothetical protein
MEWLSAPWLSESGMEPGTIAATEMDLLELRTPVLAGAGWCWLALA